MWSQFIVLEKFSKADETAPVLSDLSLCSLYLQGEVGCHREEGFFGSSFPTSHPCLHVLASVSTRTFYFQVTVN